MMSTKTESNRSGQKSLARKSLGLRLVILLALSLVLLTALVWMTLSPFASQAELTADPFGAFAQGFEGIDTLLPRLL